MAERCPDPVNAASQHRPAVKFDPIELLRCLNCGGRLSARHASPPGKDALVCVTCECLVAVRHGIPRFVDVLDDEIARRTQQSFGYEWTHFNDWRHSGDQNFADYFAGVDFASLRDCTVLDAGCGMGRHARQIAKYSRFVIAVDFSSAIEQAKLNTDDVSNVACVQADLLALPLADEAFDYVYSLGVLHHLAETEGALADLVRKVRPGGRLRVYLYWKRHGWKGRLLAIVTALRRITTRMPFPLLRASCRLLSTGLYVLVVLPYRLLSAFGVRAHREWPLFVYSKYPFTVLYNDQFDRFSAPIEKRYDANEVKRLLEQAGLRNVSVRPCFGWVGEGMKPVR
jgi:SAM-dependent methyltransferase